MKNTFWLLLLLSILAFPNLHAQSQWGAALSGGVALPTLYPTARYGGLGGGTYLNNSDVSPGFLWGIQLGSVGHYHKRISIGGGIGVQYQQFHFVQQTGSYGSIYNNTLYERNGINYQRHRNIAPQLMLGIRPVKTWRCNVLLGAELQTPMWSKVRYECVQTSTTYNGAGELTATSGPKNVTITEKNSDDNTGGINLLGGVRTWIPLGKRPLLFSAMYQYRLLPAGPSWIALERMNGVYLSVFMPFAAKKGK